MSTLTVILLVAAVSAVFGFAVWYALRPGHGQHTAPHGHADPDPDPHTGPFPVLPRPPSEPDDTGWLPATLPPEPPRPTSLRLPPAPLTRPEYLPQLGPPHAVPDIERPDIPPPGTGCDLWLPDKGPRGDYCRDPDHQAAGHDAVYSIVNTPEALAPWQPRGLPPEAVEANHGHPDADSSLNSIIMRALPDDDDD